MPRLDCTEPGIELVAAFAAAVAPAAPTGLTGTPSYEQVVLTWNVVAFATSYQVYVDGVYNQTVAAPTLTATVTELTNDVEYTFAVYALSAYGLKGPSATTTATPQGSSLMTGLTHYWRLDEVSGTRADAIGDADLTDNNTVGASPRGPSGTVADLEADNDEYLSAGNLNLSTAFTLSGWFKSESAISAYPLVLGTSDGVTRGAELLMSATQFFATQHNTDTTEFVATSPEDGIVIGAWYHLASTYSSAGDNKVHLYVNGVDVAQSAVVTGTPGTSAPIRLGLWAYGKQDGLLANAGMWSRALSAGEITSLFNSGNGKSYADLTAAEKVGLVSYWDLDEVSGDRADSHGSNTLTDNNTVGSATATAGAMHNAAAKFVPANNEYLSILYGNLATFAESSQTWSFWIKGLAEGAGGVIVWAQNEPESVYGASIRLSVDPAFRDGIVGLYLLDTDGNGISAGGQYLGLDPGVWFNIIVTWNLETKTLAGYCNGVLMRTPQVLEGTVYCPTGPLTIGAEIVEGSYFDGCVDEVAVWNRVLTADEIAELRAEGVGKFLNAGGTNFE